MILAALNEAQIAGARLHFGMDRGHSRARECDRVLRLMNLQGATLSATRTGADCRCYDFALHCRQRRMPTPARPRPNSVSVAGSGMTAGLPSSRRTLSM